MNDMTWRKYTYYILAEYTDGKHETRSARVENELYFRNKHTHKHHIQFSKNIRKYNYMARTYVKCIISNVEGEVVAAVVVELSVLSWIMCLPAYSMCRRKFNYLFYCMRNASWSGTSVPRDRKSKAKENQKESQEEQNT